MSQGTPPPIAARRRKVRRLIERDPNLSARTIATQLGVGKDTVRRDLDAIRAEQQTTEPPAPADGDRLVLALDEPLRQALAVLRATRGQPDTLAANIAIVRAAVRVMAETVLDVHKHDQETGQR